MKLWKQINSSMLLYVGLCQNKWNNIEICVLNQFVFNRKIVHLRRVWKRQNLYNHVIVIIHTIVTVNESVLITENLCYWGVQGMTKVAYVGYIDKVVFSESIEQGFCRLLHQGEGLSVGTSRAENKNNKNNKTKSFQLHMYL